MAYCKRCGAYIPDGLSACLACGYDEAAEQARENQQVAAAQAAAQAASRQNEEKLRREEQLRAKAEQRRREQQEMNRKWAESEQRRRQMQEEFRRSQEEAAARAAEQEAERRTLNEDGYARLHRTDAYAQRSAPSSADRSRILSCLSYISFLCFLPSILGVEDPFTKFHARQGRKLFFSALLLSWIPGINGVAWLFQIALAVIGIRNANSGRMEELPVVGHIGE